MNKELSIYNPSMFSMNRHRKKFWKRLGKAGQRKQKHYRKKQNDCCNLKEVLKNHQFNGKINFKRMNQKVIRRDKSWRLSLKSTKSKLKISNLNRK